MFGVSWSPEVQGELQPTIDRLECGATGSSRNCQKSCPVATPAQTTILSQLVRDSEFRKRTKLILVANIPQASTDTIDSRLQVRSTPGTSLCLPPFCDSRHSFIFGQLIFGVVPAQNQSR